MAVHGYCSGATALVALVIGIPTLNLAGGIYLVMATLGFNLIVNIAMCQWDGLTFPADPAASGYSQYFRRQVGL